MLIPLNLLNIFPKENYIENNQPHLYVKSLQSIKWTKCHWLVGNALSPYCVWPAT